MNAGPLARSVGLVHDAAMTVASTRPSPEWLDQIRPSMRDVASSGIVEVFNYGRGRQGLIPLWVGEGDLPTPPFISEAAKASLDRGETFYTYQRGVPELRAAIAAYMTRVYGASAGRRGFLAREFLRHHRRHACNRNRDPAHRRPWRRGADPLARLAQFCRSAGNLRRPRRAGPSRPDEPLEPRSGQARERSDARRPGSSFSTPPQTRPASSPRARRSPRPSPSRAGMGSGSSPTRFMAASPTTAPARPRFTT